MGCPVGALEGRNVGFLDVGLYVGLYVVFAGHELSLSEYAS